MRAWNEVGADTHKASPASGSLKFELRSGQRRSHRVIFMKKRWIKSLPILIAIISPSSLYAAPVTYDESIDGDIGFSNQFLLEPTHNYISGSVSAGSSLDSDRFYFTVPDNSKAAFTFSNSIDLGGSPYGVSFTWELHRETYIGDCSIVCLHTYEPYAGGVFKAGPDAVSRAPKVDIDLSSISFLSSGTYRLDKVGSGGSGVPWDGESWSNHLYTMNYTASFDLQPVPLPGAVYLFGTSLIALGTAARRKQRTK